MAELPLPNVELARLAPWSRGSPATDDCSTPASGGACCTLKASPGAQAQMASGPDVRHAYLGDHKGLSSWSGSRTGPLGPDQPVGVGPQGRRVVHKSREPMIYPDAILAQEN